MERPEGNVPPARSDRDLVLAFQAGDRAAYDEMYERYHHRVFGVCGRILRNPQDAEEAAQETFLRAYQALPRFNGRYQLGAWLARIAANTSVDQLRSKSRAPVVGLPHDREPVLENSDPEQLVVGDHPRLLTAIGTVKPLHARALAMRMVEGLSHQEIAERLAMTPAQVKALLHRARSSLRKAWDRAEAWMLTPVFSARALFGDRSEGHAGSPLVSAGATISPALAEKVAATALVVAVALSGFPTTVSTDDPSVPVQRATRPALAGSALRPSAAEASVVPATGSTEAAEPAGDPSVEALPRLIEDTLKGQDLDSDEEPDPAPGDDNGLPGGASATARETVHDVQKLLPHGGPAAVIADKL